jgi:hypothetical protein
MLWQPRAREKNPEGVPGIGASTRQKEGQIADPPGCDVQYQSTCASYCVGTTINVSGEHMPEYLCLQRPLPGGDPKADKPSPSQMQAMYTKFNEWREKFRDNLADMGGKLGAGRLG